MIEIEIPHDIRKYQTKLAGPFTLRNIVGGVIGLALGGGAFALCKGLPGDVKYFIVMIAALPGIGVGWLSFYSMPFEKFVGIFIRQNFIMPKRLLYCTKIEGLTLSSDMTTEQTGSAEQTEGSENATKKVKKATSNKKKKPTKYKNKSNNPDYVKYC